MFYKHFISIDDQQDFISFIATEHIFDAYDGSYYETIQRAFVDAGWEEYDNHHYRYKGHKVQFQTEMIASSFITKRHFNAGQLRYWAADMALLLDSAMKRGNADEEFRRDMDAWIMLFLEDQNS